MVDARFSSLHIPQVLDVEHFAQARVQELEFLDAAVAAVSSKGDDAFSGKGTRAASASPIDGGLYDQAHALPRHMRRRTTSHKPRRMPVALKNSNRRRTRRTPSKLLPRTTGSEEQGGQGTGSGVDGGGARIDSAENEVEKMRCRKHRRRPKALLKMHSPHVEKAQEEGAPPRWLETHIWHAKRMHMKEKWGFMLPFKSNRGPRAASEAALKHCTLQDVTFIRPLEMRARLRDLLGILTTMTDPLDGRPTHPDCVKGYVEASSHLYRVNQFPLGCVAPVTVLWSPPDTLGTKCEESETEGGWHADREGEWEEEIRRVWIWVHPAAAKEALQEIRKACDQEGAPWAGKVEVGPLADGLCRLRIRGAKSHETVKQVLRTVPAPEVAPSSSTGVATSPGDVPISMTTAACLGTAPKDCLQDDEPSLTDTLKCPLEKKSADYGNFSTEVHFEEIARENAAHWRALKSSHTTRGDGGNAPRYIPAGSVLAMTVLDPRGRPPPQKLNTPVILPLPSKAQAATSIAEAEKWPPRWAPVSPLWDPDARALSAQLAEARPDHLINESRRRERTRAAWDCATVATCSPETLEGAGGAVSVIVVSASGTATSAHDAGDAVDIYGNGVRGWGDEQKGVDRKRRVVGAGWDLILPAGWAPVFFNALVLAGARAVSLADADGLTLEASEPRFPADFPDTSAGCKYWDEFGLELEAAWARTRPKHRGYKLPPEYTLTPNERRRGCNLGTLRTTSGTECDRNTVGDTTGEIGKARVRYTKSPFRPNFRSLAGVVEEEDGAYERQKISDQHDLSTHKHGVNNTRDEGCEGGSIEDETLHTVYYGGTSGSDEKEPFAVARGFHYVRAFVPEEGTADLGAVLPPPLRLAFPTALEVLLKQDKGTPTPGSLVHPASAHHHVLWMQGRRSGKPWTGFGATSIPPSGQAIAINAAKDEPSARRETTALHELSRALGAVTSGGFSFLRGGGVGRAICEAVAVRDALLTSASCCREYFEKFESEGDYESWDARAEQPWALVLVGNDAGIWFRPALLIPNL